MATVKMQAHCLLAGAAVCAALSYPFAQGCVPVDFVHHVALAATIGGLADWWGVTAIFKRPLGINAPGSDVLRKNYDRLTGALADFVSNDLLATKNVMQAVAQENFAQLLVEYFRNDNNLQHFGDVVRHLVQHALKMLNTQQAEQLLACELPKYVANLHLPEQLIDMLQQAVAKDSFRGLWQLLAQEGRSILYKAEFQALLTGMARLAEDEYNEDSTLRKFFVGGKAEELVPVFTKQLELALADFADRDSALRRQLDNWLSAKLENYRHNVAFREWLNAKVSQLAMQYAHNAKEQWFKQDADVLFELLEEKFAVLANSERAQQEADACLKCMVQVLLEENHSTIHRLVSEKLAAYDRDELIASMEVRVGDDLQNIRKSGTYIGGLLGGLLFVIEFVAERLVG